MKTFLAVSLLILTSAAPAAEPAQRTFAVVDLPNPRAVAVDRAGNLYVGDVATPKVYKITRTGQVTALGVGGPTIADPIGLAVGRDGIVYVSDADANTIYQILPDDRVVLWAKPSPAPTDTSLSAPTVGSSRVDLQACKLEYSIVSPK